MKKVFFSVFILSIVAISFFSCSTDSAPSIAEGKLSFSIISASKSNAFQPLNYIPEDVVKKMDAVELSVWKKMSSCFYIDYDIINTSYYKKNKASFLCDMEELYEEAKSKQNAPQRLIFTFPNSAFETKFSLLELDDSTSGSGSGSDFDSDSIYIEDTPIDYEEFISEKILYRFASGDVYLCVSAYINMTGTVRNPIFGVRSQSVYTDPKNAHFSGYAEITPADQGVNLDAKGRLTYRSAFATVDEHYYIKIIPKSNT